MPYSFSKTSKIWIYELKFLKLQQFQYLINLSAYYTLFAMNKHTAMNKERMLKITKQYEQNTECKKTA